MLQFSPTVYSITNRFTSRLLWRVHTSLMSNAATVSNANVKEAVPNIVTNDVQHTAFNQLKIKLCTDLDTKSSVVSKINSAENVHDLLQVIKEPLLTQAQIINLLHTITLWVNENNNRVSGDPPTNNLTQSNKYIQMKEEKAPASDRIDFSQYHDLSTAQMIKEVKKLALEGKRDVQLLNYFYENIVTYSEELSPEYCSSLMYSMGRVSYSDERLLKKICTDLIWHFSTRSVVIPVTVLVSIIKSTAIIRYRNDTFLQHVCHDILNPKDQTRYANHHIASILLSFAKLDYQSANIDKILKRYGPGLSCSTLGHSDWLDVVWSLIVFQRVEQSQITSVLNENFIKKLMFYDSKRRVTYQLKLLNIDSYARYILKGYDGPPIVPTLIPPVVAKPSKQKVLYVQILEDTLKNLLPSATHYKMSVNTEMGFFLDAELHMDSNMTSVEVRKDVNKEIFKIGILLLDYYDVVLGSRHELGLIKLYTKLLASKNYRVICVPYQHFSKEDKVEKRVSYIKRQIWLKLNEPA